MSLLNSIDSPADLKKLREEQLPAVCHEIREFLLHTLSQTGGHLASNLGSVELTVALHYIFDSPRDKFCWDVGHQTYVHKILTGRKDRLKTVRTTDGLSGFPKIDESEHDHYNTGHAGTSISQAFAEALARDIRLRAGEEKKFYQCISIIGDASIASGMAFEALNHAGDLQTPFLVILNDNEMSISANVGALNYTLGTFRNLKLYKKWKGRFYRFVRWLPLLGPIFERWVMKFKKTMEFFITDHRFFEELGFGYAGPIDGHDVIKLVHIFRKLKETEKPVLLHVITRKGKGYHPAEQDPVTYHGVKPFETLTGNMKSSGDKWPLSSFVGASLAELKKKHPHLCVITPAMKEGSGLTAFAEAWPAEFFDCGIAEQHATTLAGGLAKAGMQPFLAIYSTFLQRGYDQLIHDIALMNLPVKLVLDRAGCVGGDGETHQGLYDFAFMNCIPNLKLLSAATPQELMQMLSFMAAWNGGPISVRFPKKDFRNDLFTEWKTRFEKDGTGFPEDWDPFRAEIIARGKDAVLFTEGTMLHTGLQAREILETKGISLEVVSLKSLRPLDLETIREASTRKKAVFTLENHVIRGGVGESLFSELRQTHPSLPGEIFAFPDEPIEHGIISEMESRHELDALSVASRIRKKLEQLKENQPGGRQSHSA